jgi:hypothetical protein
LTNQEAVISWMDIFAGHLAGLRAALARGDERELRRLLNEARQGRAAIADAARW